MPSLPVPPVSFAAPGPQRRSMVSLPAPPLATVGPVSGLSASAPAPPSRRTGTTILLVRGAEADSNAICNSSFPARPSTTTAWTGIGLQIAMPTSSLFTPKTEGAQPAPGTTFIRTSLDASNADTV